MYQTLCLSQMECLYHLEDNLQLFALRRRLLELENLDPEQYTKGLKYPQ